MLLCNMIGNLLSAPDPYIMSELAGNPGYLDTTAKTLSSQTLNNGIRNCILLIAGQSNACNNAPSAYTPTNTGKVDCLNPYNGAIYAQIDPMLGCSSPASLGIGNGCFAGRLADKLINASLFDRVIICNVAVNGTSAADWVNLYPNRLSTALARLSYRGMTPTAILWSQGEKDNVLSTAQAAYQSSMTTVIGATRTAGYSGPWFIPQQTWDAGSTSSTIQAAQAALVNHGSGIWAGPNADSLNATNRQSDNTHWNDTGSDAYAGLWLTALQAFGAPF